MNPPSYGLSHRLIDSFHFLHADSKVLHKINLCETWRHKTCSETKISSHAYSTLLEIKMHTLTPTHCATGLHKSPSLSYCWMGLRRLFVASGCLDDMPWSRKQRDSMEACSANMTNTPLFTNSLPVMWMSGNPNHTGLSHKLANHRDPWVSSASCMHLFKACVVNSQSQEC